MGIDTLGPTYEANKSILLQRKGVIGVAHGKEEVVVFQDKDEANKEEIPKEINGIPIRIVETGRFRFLSTTNDNNVKITVIQKTAPPEIRHIQTIGCSNFECCFRIFYTPPIPADCKIHTQVNEEECSIIKYDSESIDIIYHWDYKDKLAFLLWFTCDDEKGAESKPYTVDTLDQICAYIDDDLYMCAGICFWYNDTCNRTPRELTETPNRMKEWKRFHPGVGIGDTLSPILGTFGCVVKKDGKRMLLSNRHVIVPNTGIGDTKVIQGSIDNVIGDVKLFTEYKEQPGKNYADCAIAEVYNDANMLTEILDESDRPTIIPSGTTEPHKGQRVVKSGAKTGLVTGEVLYTDVLATISAGEVPYDFEDAIITTLISKDGDSGSLLLEKGTNKAVGLAFAADPDKRYTIACKISHVLTAMGCTLDTLPTIKENAMFLIHTDPQTGDETVEVHPYIMFVPGETTPVISAIVNTGNEPIAVDMWEVFGGIELPPHRTPVIPVGETINFDYMTTRPDLPLGQYQCTFYIGQHDEGVTYDEFTQPAIIIVDHIIYATSDELSTPAYVQPGQTYQGELCVDIGKTIGADSAFADIWVCKDGDKTWEKMKEVDMTIVDRRLWPLMEETRTGLTRTEALYPDNHYCLEFEFAIPTDWVSGTYELDLYFGEWDQYFIFWGDIPRSFTVEIPEGEVDWICPWCGFKSDNVYDLHGHVENNHTPCINTLPEWAVHVPYCIYCGMNFIGGTSRENLAAYHKHQNEFEDMQTQRSVITKFLEEGRASELPFYWLDPPSAPGYVDVIPMGYYIYIDRQYAGYSPRAISCGPSRAHEIRLIDTSNTILLDENFTVGEGETINIGGGLPDITLDIPPPAPLPTGTCRVVIPTAGYTVTVEGHSYTSPLEFFILIEADSGGPLIVASGVVKLAWNSSLIEGTLELFKLRSGLLWTVDIRKTIPSLMDQIYDYIPTEESVVLVMKPTATIPEPQYIDGTIDIPASDIPTTLYQQTPSAFDMQVINTGTVSAQYQVAITFEGIDVANEEVFWSDWSVEVASNESTTLPVLVELSERAIPEEAETAEYNIITKLVAR